MLKMSSSKPKSQSTHLELEGVIEELRRDKKMYQKTAMLHLRCVPQCDCDHKNVWFHFK